MINLMPTPQKQAIYYARRNTVILNWLAGLGLALVGVVVIISGSLFYLRQDSSTLKTSIDNDKKHLSAQKEEETLARAEEMSGNLKLAVDVLSNEVLFSRLLQQLGLVLPRGTVLQSLSLSSNIASSGINLEISAVDYESGSRAHVNLNDPDNGIFERADLEGITCSEADSSDPAYPCQVSIRALFGADNPFLLIGGDD